MRRTRVSGLRWTWSTVAIVGRALNAGFRFLELKCAGFNIIQDSRRDDAPRPTGSCNLAAGAENGKSFHRESRVTGIKAQRIIGSFAAWMVLASSGAASPTELAGKASVIDGDTLEIHGTRVRLWGIDAPESTQLCRGADSNLYRCGAKAANELDAFVARRPLSCKPISQDQYGRTVATCSVDGVDLGEWLVHNGLALDWPHYSRGQYAVAQRTADHAGRGMWAGSYVEPWLYRTCVRLGGRPASCSDDANAHP